MEAAGVPTAAGYPTEGALPEVASVPWRPRASAETLRRRGVHWTVFTTLHVVPFLIIAVVLVLLNPIAVPVAIASLAHAWIIPGLYAQRGANTIKPKRSGRNPSEPVAQGLLADMLGHAERELQRATGLALEASELGVWLVGEAGAALVVRGGRRVHCFCVSADDRGLPPSDRIAHLLLALRTDESGFATVANHAFSGATWRLARRMDRGRRPALCAARQLARAG